jgi:hypothetical protein
MISLIQKIKEDNILGCIKYNGICDMYLMPIAWWILNHEKYDPNYNPKEWKFEFRDNIFNVTNDKIDQFLISIDAYKLSIVDLNFLIKNTTKEDHSVCFYIDFDKKLFVSAFNEIEVEEYLPSIDWKGIFVNPFEFMPNELKLIFTN